MSPQTTTAILSEISDMRSRLFEAKRRSLDSEKRALDSERRTLDLERRLDALDARFMQRNEYEAANVDLAIVAAMAPISPTKEVTEIDRSVRSASETASSTLSDAPMTPTVPHSIPLKSAKAQSPRKRQRNEPVHVIPIRVSRRRTEVNSQTLTSHSTMKSETEPRPTRERHTPKRFRQIDADGE